MVTSSVPASTSTGTFRTASTAARRPYRARPGRWADMTVVGVVIHDSVTGRTAFSHGSPANDRAAQQPPHRSEAERVQFLQQG